MDHSLRCFPSKTAALFIAVWLGACGTAGPETGPGEAVTDNRSSSGNSEVAARPSEPEVDDDPERLIGLGPGGLFALLGEPELIRRENPAQVWQYRGGICVFDVVLYQEDDGQRVSYVEARDGSGNRTEPRPCLNELLRAHLAKASS